MRFQPHELHPVLTGHRRKPGEPRDKPRHMPMSDTFSKVEAITSVARRRRFSNDAARHVDQLCCPSSWALAQPGVPLEAADERGRQGSGARRLAASKVRRVEQRVRELNRLRVHHQGLLKGHEERFPPTRLSAGCGFRKETIAGMRRNGRDAPEAVVRRQAENLSGLTLNLSFKLSGAMAHRDPKSTSPSRPATGAS
jgi:hypothetical protein